MVREFKFTDGWLVRLGRGLDIFKSDNPFPEVLQNVPCRETMIVFYHDTLVK